MRHLKPIQIWARLWLKIYRPSVSGANLPVSKNFNGLISSCAEKPASMVGPREWLMLNQGGKLDEIGWQSNERNKLWRYNQHYFDDLNALGSHNRFKWHNDLINRWIKENPCGHGHGWEPYPTSLRIVNWIKWDAVNGKLSQVATESLAIQSRWLARRVEWHLLGNHLFANAKALVFSGLYFDGKEADQWLCLGLKILQKQVPEQILADGAHFELSPMYHAILLEDLLDIINITYANMPRIDHEYKRLIDGWCERIPQMMFWLFALSHPDGKISFFNDAAFDVAPSNDEIIAYAKRLNYEYASPTCGITDLRASGMVRLQKKNAVVIADLAPIGPDYLPGHAHADTLSFECSVHRQRIFVNSGTSLYDISLERLKQRSTLAHNTVCIEGENSSEVWSSFRVGSRAKILERKVWTDNASLYAFGVHDGYSQKYAGLTHSRKFTLGENQIIVTDVLSKNANAEVRFFVHPDIKIKQSHDFGGELQTRTGEVLNWTINVGSFINIEDTDWFPNFGLRVPNKCIIATFSGCKCELFLRWD